MKDNFTPANCLIMLFGWFYVLGFKQQWKISVKIKKLGFEKKFR